MQFKYPQHLPTYWERAPLWDDLVLLTHQSPHIHLQNSLSSESRAVDDSLNVIHSFLFSLIILSVSALWEDINLRRIFSIPRFWSIVTKWYPQRFFLGDPVCAVVTPDNQHPHFSVVGTHVETHCQEILILIIYCSGIIMVVFIFVFKYSISPAGAADK